MHMMMVVPSSHNSTYYTNSILFQFLSSLWCSMFFVSWFGCIRFGVPLNVCQTSEQCYLNKKYLSPFVVLRLYSIVFLFACLFWYSISVEISPLSIKPDIWLSSTNFQTKLFLFFLSFFHCLWTTHYCTYIWIYNKNNYLNLRFDDDRNIFISPF